MEGLLQRDAGAFPSTSGGWEEPVWVAVPSPKVAEADEEFGADRDFTRLAALGVGDAQDEAFAVDVLGADVECFVQA